MVSVFTEKYTVGSACPPHSRVGEVGAQAPLRKSFL